MKIKLLLAFVLTFVLSIATFAQTAFDKAKLDQFFDALAAKDKAMGSLTVSKDGKVLYSRAIGYSRIDEKSRKASTVETKYRIGSISKTFTATMIFQLVDEGKLKLTDTLDKYFPNVPNAAKITIGNLLSHRSGIHSFTDDVDYLSWNSKPQAQAELLARMVKSKPDFEPNGKAEYSNSNYVLLGWIVEKVTGKTYQVNLKERIADKINLKNTYLGGKTDITNNESYSYNFLDGWKFSPETDMSVPGGAGAVISTPTDLTKFAEALFDKKLISEASLKQMTTITEGYGMGIFQYPVYDKIGFGHSGGIDGFNSMLIYVPSEKLSVAYISNGMNLPINDIILAAFATALNKPFNVPTFETFIVKSEDLDKYLGVYSTPNMSLKITVTKDGTKLKAQATGQSAFPLEPTAKDKFKFDAAGITVEFFPEKSQFVIKQGGGDTLFTKDK